MPVCVHQPPGPTANPGAGAADHDGRVPRRLDDQVVDDLVARSLLMLLAARMQVARLHRRQRRRPLPALAQALGEQLVVPQPKPFQLLRPDGKDARRFVTLCGHQVIDARELQHGVALERLVECKQMHDYYRKLFQAYVHLFRGRLDEAERAFRVVFEIRNTGWSRRAKISRVP